MNWKTAGAELLIIVIGIVLALAVDRWADERRDATVAHEYIARLKNDIAIDLAAYADTVTWSRSIDASAQYVLDVYRGRNPPPMEYDQFALHIYRASWAAMGRPTSTTYDDLISTGNISLLPVDVRDAITKYYGIKSTYANRMKLLEETAMKGYWRVPAAVFGPDLAPSVWLAIQGRNPDFITEPGSLGIDEDGIGRIADALRAIDNLEYLLAEIRHQMAQRTILFGERLPKAAREFEAVIKAYMNPDSLQ
jgi:hypothetical protein